MLHIVPVKVPWLDYVTKSPQNEMICYYSFEPLTTARLIRTKCIQFCSSLIALTFPAFLGRQIWNIKITFKFQVPGQVRQWLYIPFQRIRVKCHHHFSSSVFELIPRQIYDFNFPLPSQTYKLEIYSLHNCQIFVFYFNAFYTIICSGITHSRNILIPSDFERTHLKVATFATLGFLNKWSVITEMRSEVCSHFPFLSAWPVCSPPPPSLMM